jgi:peptidyl serine alpha-galactosyltransferase
LADADHTGKPWISEMYGYAFAAAKHNMWHQVDHTSMYVPTISTVRAAPKLLHINDEIFVGLADGREFSFDKRRHMNFNFDKCPPWNMSSESIEGLFQHPPSVKDLPPDQVRNSALGCCTSI